jgi:hypothetical protein
LFLLSGSSMARNCTSVSEKLYASSFRIEIDSVRRCLGHSGRLSFGHSISAEGVYCPVRVSSHEPECGRLVNTLWTGNEDFRF